MCQLAGDPSTIKAALAESEFLGMTHTASKSIFSNQDCTMHISAGSRLRTRQRASLFFDRFEIFLNLIDIFLKRLVFLDQFEVTGA